MKILRLRSWNFQAPNLDAMTRFYQTALGADLRAQQTLAGVKVNRLSAGETGLGLFDASEKQFPACTAQVRAIRFTSPIRTETVLSCPKIKFRPRMEDRE